MQRLFQVSLFGLVLALSACGNEAEDTPDITEAIPLNVDEEGDATIDDAASGDGASGDTPALPGAPEERALPDTMESGSNPPGYEPPEGSKVQRIK